VSGFLGRYLLLTVGYKNHPFYIIPGYNTKISIPTKQTKQYAYETLKDKQQSRKGISLTEKDDQTL